MKFKEGEYVRVIQREQTSADVKNATFYPFFCGMAGTVERLYEEEICIKVDLDTLPDDVRKRHLEIQEAMKKKWLNGLSGEARNRLTPEEKQFELAYTILVQAADLEKSKPGKPKLAAEKETPSAKVPTPANNVSKGGPKPEPQKTVSSTDLEAAELAFLQEREKALKNKK